jgi:hypothetical protein
MKKVISISLTCLLLLALVHVSVAKHYCMGNIAASKISFSGELATCGMENDENQPPLEGVYFKSHCCDNLLVFCGISGNYFPSFTFVPESNQPLSQFCSAPASLNIYTFEPVKSVISGVDPPGAPAPNKVDLSAICVYRI